MPQFELSRREAMAGLAAAVASPIVANAAPAFAVQAEGRAEAEATALLGSIAESLLSASPEIASSLGVDTGARAPLKHKLADRSGIGQQRIAQMVRFNLGRANAIDVGGLTHSTRTSVEVVKSAFKTALEGFQLPYGDVPIAYDSWRKSPYVVSQNTGAYVVLPRFLDSEHKIETADDAEAYLDRLKGLAGELDNETGRLIMARYKGLIPPGFLVDTALGQMRKTLEGARTGGPMVESIARRTREKNILGNWSDRARSITRNEIAPALERQIAEVSLQRRSASNEAGMWARPNGDEYYRWALKASTTTTLSPDDIHQIGIDTLARLHGEMDKILTSLGYSNGSVGARMKAIAADRRYTFPQNDAGRSQIMAFIQERIARIRAKMPQAFNTLVKGNLEVRRLPPEEEPGAAGAYGGAGSIDGSVPGKFWINLKQGHDHTKYNLPSLTHHEAIPGHVWEGEYTNTLPLIRTLLSFGAFSEGWALYAEQLADELGVYDDDPAGRLGYFDSIAFRATRLVVDTGLHAKRWSRERARAFFMEALGNPNESEVDRYCSWPGQACSYEMGHQAINRERDRAKAALGQRFDLKAFNDAVVLGGNVPMDVLAKNVDWYVGSARG